MVPAKTYRLVRKCFPNYRDAEILPSLRMKTCRMVMVLLPPPPGMKTWKVQKVMASVGLYPPHIPHWLGTFLLSPVYHFISFYVFCSFYNTGKHELSLNLYTVSIRIRIYISTTTVSTFIKTFIK